MDSDLISLLVFVAISALSALSNWLQKRKQAAEEPELWPPTPAEAPPAPRQVRPVTTPGRTTSAPVSTPKAPPAPASPSPQPTAPRMSDWEAELRRLLEGMEKPAAPPPVIVVTPAPTPPPPPPPPLAPAPRPAARPASPWPTRERAPQPIYAEATEEAPEPSRRLAVLQQSADAHAKASRIHDDVAVRMRRFERLTEDPVGGRAQADEVGSVKSAEGLAAREWLGDRSGLRQAMIASIILGPPRSAEV